jgi:nucleotide-binding universal stress UspA family protein
MTLFTINPHSTPLLNPIGILIALLFIASIAAVLGWMLRVPKETEQTVTASKAIRSMHKMTRILVPLLHGNETTDRAVALAAQMTRHRNGNVEVLAVLEVPHMLPLDARVEMDEKRASAYLERAESVAAHSSIKVIKRILKARSAGAAIVREAEEKAVDLIIIANTPQKIRGTISQIDPTVEYVMKNAPCEVLVLSQVRTSETTQHKVHENIPIPAPAAQSL